MEYIKIICLISIIKLCNSNNNNDDIYEISEIKKLENKLICLENEQLYKYQMQLIKNALNNEVIVNSNQYINYFVDKQNKIKDMLPQQLLISSMIDYISNKKWNQDLVDIVPIIISKIVEHKLVVFEIFDDYFLEHNQTYNNEFTRCIYLKLDSQHYQSITKHPNLELTKQSQFNNSLIKTDLTDINSNIKKINNGKKKCKHCGIFGHTTDTNKNCLKYEEKSEIKKIKREPLELADNITLLTNENNITNQVKSNTPKKRDRNSSGSPKKKKQKYEFKIEYPFEASLKEKEILTDYNSALAIFQNMKEQYKKIIKTENIKNAENNTNNESNKKKEYESSIFKRLKKLHSQYEEIDSQKVVIGFYGGNFENFLILFYVHILINII